MHDDTATHTIPTCTFIKTETRCTTNYTSTTTKNQNKQDTFEMVMTVEYCYGFLKKAKCFFGPGHQARFVTLLA